MPKSFYSAWPAHLVGLMGKWSQNKFELQLYKERQIQTKKNYPSVLNRNVIIIGTFLVQNGPLSNGGPTVAIARSGKPHNNSNAFRSLIGNKPPYVALTQCSKFNNTLKYAIIQNHRIWSYKVVVLFVSRFKDLLLGFFSCV